MKCRCNPIKDIPGHVLAHCLAALLFLLAGCTANPGFSPPTGTALRPLGKADAGTPIAWSADGSRLALARDGLIVLSLKDAKRLRLSAEKPSALAWSPDGTRLAAGFAKGDETRIKLYDNGRAGEETLLKGEVEGLFWPRQGEVLAVAHRLRRYSFGANFAGVLFRWDGRARPAEERLFDITLRPRTLALLGGKLGDVMRPELSPYGDELLYGRLHDPPVFTPYVQVVLHHLSTGAEHEVKTISLASGGTRYLAQGDELLLADGSSETYRLDPWAGTASTVGPWAGRTLAANTGGGRLLVDGHLLRQGKEVATLPPATEGWFSPEGDRLLLRRGESLFLLSGLGPEVSPPCPQKPSKLLLWRSWRAKGLITQAEYLALVRKAER